MSPQALEGALTRAGWAWGPIAAAGALHLAPPVRLERSTTACYLPLGQGEQLSAFEDGPHCGDCLARNGGIA